MKIEIIPFYKRIIREYFKANPLGAANKTQNNTQMKKITQGRIVTYHTTEEDQNAVAGRNGTPKTTLVALVTGVNEKPGTPEQPAVEAAEGVEARAAIPAVEATTTVNLRVFNDGQAAYDLTIENCTEGTSPGNWSFPLIEEANV